jgi:hypothetical protein
MTNVLMIVNANSCEANFIHSVSIHQLMHGRAFDDLQRGEEAIKSHPRTFFWLCGSAFQNSKVVWHLVIMTSANFLLILYDKHMLMMYECLLIPNQIS